MSPELATNIEGTRPGSAAEPLLAAELARWFAAAATGLLLATAITLVWRRLAGALENPLSWHAMLSAGILLSAAATAARAAWRRPRRPATIAAGLTSAGVLSAALALTVPAAPPAAIILLWAPVTAGEFWAWGVGIRRMWPSSLLGSSDEAVAAKGQAIPGAGPVATRSLFQAVADDVLQQQIRSRGADGTETLRGWLRAPLAPGQRSASVHVAFCPPFPRAPRVLVEQREGPLARIKAAQVLPHGARFDLKLAQPNESAADIVLEFSAEGTREV